MHLESCHPSHRHPHTSLSQFLIDHGAFVNATDKYELTALHHAAIRGNLNAVKKLLAAPGIDKEVRKKLTFLKDL